jgi:hypothetical protein
VACGDAARPGRWNNRAMATIRVALRQRVSASLGTRSAIELAPMMRIGRVISEGASGGSELVDVDGVPVFTKQIPLTDQEVAHSGSTANLFDVPMFCQYGTGGGSTPGESWPPTSPTPCWLARCNRSRSSHPGGYSLGRVVAPGVGTVTGDPKFKRSRRALPRPTDILPALRKFKVQQAAERLSLGQADRESGLIAVNADGSPIRPKTACSAECARGQSAGVHTVQLHKVRHTAATMLLDGGTTAIATAKWLGRESRCHTEGLWACH